MFVTWWTRVMRAELVDPVGWKANWSERCTERGGYEKEGRGNVG